MTVMKTMVVIAGLVMLPGAALFGAEANTNTEAAQILQATGVKGGIVVVLNCGDGKLAASLGVIGYVVQGLDADPQKVLAARNYLQSQNLYGKASVEHWTSPNLPYTDNLINLIVSDGGFAISQDEMLRVLAPGGVAYVKVNGKWKKTIKSWPADIDQWTHFLHDASNNAVAHDTRVGPPRSLQWLAPPLWMRSHETPSGFQAMVSGNGRMFYILDEGVMGVTDQRLPERWALFCRDAFNGTLLWRQPLGRWGWPEWVANKIAKHDWTTIIDIRTAVPDENQRRLVVDGDRLYTTMAYMAPLSILDAATGRTLAVVEETSPARQIIAADGIAVVYSSTAAPAPPSFNRRAKFGNDPGTLFAVKGATGKVLWRKNVSTLRDLSLAINGGRVVYQDAKQLMAVDLATGRDSWKIDLKTLDVQTLVINNGVVVLRTSTTLEAYDATSGAELWSKTLASDKNLWSEDLFIIQGVVWPGTTGADKKQQPNHRHAKNAMAIGYDLRTGAECKRVFAADLLSPEHHHRCYRNKATDRYIINSMEGAEFLDLMGANHSQNNFLRGVCRLGMMPANGLLYAPPDQCFCQPGAKLLGLTAVGPEPEKPVQPLADEQRLQRGPAYGQISDPQLSSSPQPSALPADWPTFRHDAARHGSTPSPVKGEKEMAPGWRVKLGGRLTAPVAVGDRVYVASIDSHTLHVLDMKSGRSLWTFVAGARIDSPPTIVGQYVLMGSADGWVYCLRADDGALVWRFLAAPCDRRIASDSQIESVWPVHGSVLVQNGVAYMTAGRSSYLDGGIRLYGLDLVTGKILHQITMSGPFPDGKAIPRDVSFFINGVNSEVLVSEGNAIYMRQKKFDLSLQEEKVDRLSNKGEADVGLHLFSTSGLLDSSWYNRVFWFYARRWPGFQLANQASKAGQLLVIDNEHTYGINCNYRRNIHTPMFFPGKEGFLLFADRNDNEMQIVGDKGSRMPVAWLPQSDYIRNEGLQKLGDQAFGRNKMMGYTRAEPPVWKTWLPVMVRAMVKAGDTIFVAGQPDVFDASQPYASFDGQRGAKLMAVAAKDGKPIAERLLDTIPVFDGMIAAGGRLLVSLEDGSLACFGGEEP